VANIYFPAWFPRLDGTASVVTGGLLRLRRLVCTTEEKRREEKGRKGKKREEKGRKGKKREEKGREGKRDHLIFLGTLALLLTD
jgi:hypothetical protein